jgi:hypothetical protein
MGAQMEGRFTELTKAWRAHLLEVMDQSLASRAIACDAFDALVALGPDAIPLILREYQGINVPWGAVLARITGETALGDGLTGNRKDTRERWLAWARQHGYA